MLVTLEMTGSILGHLYYILTLPLKLEVDVKAGNTVNFALRIASAGGSQTPLVLSGNGFTHTDYSLSLKSV